MLGDVASDRSGTPPSRIVGVDIARGLAILGMFVAHTMPNPSDTELVVDGRSSILFATLAGASLGILSGQDFPSPRGSRAAIYRVVLIRALFVFLLGIVLTSLGSEIAIILDYYAIMFVLVLPLLFLPRGVLAALLVVVALAAPALASAVADQAGDVGTILGGAREYLLTGYYPALVWIPFLLAGLIAARSGLTRPATQLFLIVLGSISAVAGYQVARLSPEVTAAAHSGSTAEIFGSGGVAVAVLGVVLLLTSSAPAVVRRFVTTVLSPVAAAGSMALSVYTAQILVLAVAVQIRDGSGAVDYPGWPLLFWLIAGTLVFSWLWQRFLGKGPLERVLAIVTGPRSH
ncbi:DUF418 domain-containing protein [Mycetocola zhadangensis]|uniref:DUF418 domain-containing protein n=1 Tax=Mycetocola zhadangensis TaxID=1164595 RepID=A0A3L7J634_9MICO|nr:DUF418 domain-containing protein [Mycetocola zhadangensis]RLQ85825.1 DUF418 domain-containing protein [Mycetocola zhadangensis]GGE86158.1 hypothetical protein GCM10011313_05740 [Mycetocola zhadangensis]